MIFNIFIIIGGELGITQELLLSFIHNWTRQKMVSMNWMSLIDDTMRQTPGWRFIHIEPLGRGPWVMIRAKIQEPSGRLVNIPEV